MDAIEVSLFFVIGYFFLVRDKSFCYRVHFFTEGLIISLINTSSISVVQKNAVTFNFKKQ